MKKQISSPAAKKTAQSAPLKFADSMDISQAVAEANRCLLCYDPPCSKACPAGTDPGTFIRKLRLRNITGAIRTIKNNNILGGACGILCPTSRLCEQECSACGLDRPIQIGKLQRFLIEHSWQQNIEVTAASVNKTISNKTGKVAVVGSGPSGLACAATIAREGYSVTVFEARKKIGGVLRYGVPSFRLPEAFLDRELADLKKLGIEFKCSTPVKGKSAIEGLLKDGYRAVFVGTGLWESARLDVPVRPPGVVSSIEFLADFRSMPGKKLSENLKGKTVGIIGGGSVAIDCARVARDLGAVDVYLIYRRSFQQMPAEPDERIEALSEGIHFLLLNQPAGFISDKSGKLIGIKLLRTTLGDSDASGRRQPVEVPGSDWELKLDLVVEAIGNIAPIDLQESMPRVKTDQRRLIRTDNATCLTSVRGIFAGGDIVRGPALVVEAVKDGKIAAKSIIEALEGGEI